MSGLVLLKVLIYPVLDVRPNGQVKGDALDRAAQQAKKVKKTLTSSTATSSIEGLALKTKVHVVSCWALPTLCHSHGLGCLLQDVWFYCKFAIFLPRAGEFSRCQQEVGQYLLLSGHMGMYTPKTSQTCDQDQDIYTMIKKGNMPKITQPLGQSCTPWRAASAEVLLCGNHGASWLHRTG